jgi:hypothetical protein
MFCITYLSRGWWKVEFSQSDFNKHGTLHRVCDENIPVHTWEYLLRTSFTHENKLTIRSHRCRSLHLRIRCNYVTMRIHFYIQYSCVTDITWTQHITSQHDLPFYPTIALQSARATDWNATVNEWLMPKSMRRTRDDTSPCFISRVHYETVDYK